MSIVSVEQVSTSVEITPGGAVLPDLRAEFERLRDVEAPATATRLENHLLLIQPPPELATGPARLRVTAEIYGPHDGELEVICHVPGIPALLGHGWSREEAIEDLVDGLVHDLEVLQAMPESQLTGDAIEHLRKLQLLWQPGS